MQDHNSEIDLPLPRLDDVAPVKDLDDNLSTNVTVPSAALERIKVFYNVYANPDDDVAILRAKYYVNEQMAELLPKHQVFIRSIGKQFEIISLLLLRDAFKEFGHYMGELNWDPKLLLELLPMVADGFGAVLIFGMTALFYRTQKHQKITQSNEEQSEFIGVKKILSLYLALVFFLIILLDITRAWETGVVSFSIQSFYTLLIFTDIFILIFSFTF